MRNRLSGFLAMLLVTVFVLSVMPAIKAQPPLPAMWITPTTLNFDTGTTAVGALFNVTLYAGTASDVYAYNWYVLFDTSQLAAITGGYTGPGRSQWFSSHSTSASGPYVDNTAGEVYGGESLLGSDIVHASSGSIAWLEFQIIADPTPGNTLTSTIDPNSPDSYFLDFDLFHIPNVSFGLAAYTYSGGVTPPPRHEVVVSSVTPASDHVTQGNPLSIEVVALNNGTVTETFNVNATYDGTLIGTQTVTSLAAGNTQTLTFSWNTTSVAAGNYTITATATPVTGQTDLSNISKNAEVQVLLPRHEVVVSSVTPASDHVTQGNPLSIEVVALNNGTVTETFNVNATYDGTLIGTQTVTSLAAGNTQTLTFSWNTTSVAAGNYTITATATPVTGQTDLSNISKNAEVQVLPPGPSQNPYDFDGNGKIDITDVAVVAKAFGSSQSNPQGRWNPKADVYGPNGVPDGTVDLFDIAIVAKNFG